MATLRHIPPGYLIGMGAWILAGILVLRWLLRLRRRNCGNWNRRINSGLLSLWLVLAVLTGCEIAFALFADFTDSISLTNISRRWFRIHVQANASGYRDGPLRKQRTPGVTQIAFLGDSFTLGHGIENVEDRFSNRVAAALERVQPRGFQVANLGVLGADIKDVGSNFTRERARGYRPHIAVYVYCLNDIERMDRRNTDAYFWEIGASEPKCFVTRETYFLNFLYFRARQYQLAGVRDYFGFLQDYYAPPHKAWDSLAKNFDVLRASCKRQGITFAVVIFPFVHYRSADYPFTQAHRRLTAYCADHNVPCLDLLPVLQPHFDEGLAVNAFDAHPNERAHELAAHAMTGWLIDSLRQQTD